MNRLSIQTGISAITIQTKQPEFLQGDWLPKLHNQNLRSNIFKLVIVTQKANHLRYKEKLKYIYFKQQKFLYITSIQTDKSCKILGARKNS